ncbi:MAG: 3-isopropylmalate dehydratase [Candidatus Omnitrophica bacterium]|nr:3-isopropylmalate dehydratase [Candidatus Omnitrophota bacterium]
MQKIVRGKAYVVGNDVDTDQIIPAKYLSYNPAIPEERRMFGRFALSGLAAGRQGLPSGTIPFVKEGAERSEYAVVVGGKNFGCGSSREHASICLKEAGIGATVALFYSRIFFRNSVNGGYLIPFESKEDLSVRIRTGDEVEIDVEKNVLTNHTLNQRFELKALGDILPILSAGNVFEYAKKMNLIKNAPEDQSVREAPEEPEDDC